MFNIYETFGNEANSNPSGTGLGLVICKNLVGILGPVEKIDVKSEIGQGSEFTFIIY